MRCFIAGTGKIDVVTCEHVIYAKTIRGMSLSKLLKSAVRVKIHNRFLAFETSKNLLTPAQKSAINRLYRKNDCLGYTGKIGRKTHTTSSFEYILRVNFTNFEN